jgi:uncharacterized protein (TIGR00369 family)
LSDIFRFEADPDDPQWAVWELIEHGRFNSFLGALRVRRKDEKAVVRMMPSHQHTNFPGDVHGGLMMGFIDCALFAAAFTLTGEASVNSVTLECSTQFLSPGRADVPLDAVIEVLRETRGFIFQRGVLEQDGVTVASFSAILRKFSPRT